MEEEEEEQQQEEEEEEVEEEEDSRECGVERDIVTFAKRGKETDERTQIDGSSVNWINPTNRVLRSCDVHTRGYICSEQKEPVSGGSNSGSGEGRDPRMWKERGGWGNAGRKGGRRGVRRMHEKNGVTGRSMAGRNFHDDSLPASPLSRYFSRHTLCTRYVLFSRL